MSGFRVLGIDVDAERVRQLNEGQSYVPHIPSTAIADLVEDRLLEATDRPERLSEPDIVVVAVPTPLTETRAPDLHYLEESAHSIARVLRPGQLVVMESTTYPGTTRAIVRPILQSTGLELGRDFFLAYSPDREDPGNPHYGIANIPKVVSGMDTQSLELAGHFYAQVVDTVVPVSSPEVAEACKVLENSYRAVNIALVNELKMLFDRMGIDIWEVIEAAKTKPFGFQTFYPGPGLGGPCIPKDPFYLAWIAHKYDMPTRFIELAGEINLMMPEYVVSRLVDALNARGKAVRDRRIALLGMAYKKDVGDPRRSPGFPLLDRLLHLGAEVTYNDPYLQRLPKTRRYPHLPNLVSQPLTPEYLQEQDCLLIVTDHSAYNWQWIASHAELIVDTRNATRAVTEHRERIVLA